MYTTSNTEKINKTKVVRHILEDRFQKLQACMFSDVFVVGDGATMSRVFKIKQGSRGRRPRRPVYLKQNKAVGDGAHDVPCI